MIPLNDLRRSHSNPIGDELKVIANKVLQSGQYILGEEVFLFEKEFGSYLDSSFVSAVASGSDALVIALRSLGVNRGSIVATVPNAGGYATCALLEIGAKPVFVDCDSMGRMDPDKLLVALEEIPGIVCVVATHLYGLNSNIKRIQDLCRRFGVRLLEDCAQSTGAEVGGVKLGNFGDAATFSFYPTKNLGALGDAGAIATNSKVLATCHNSLRQYGWSARYEVTTQFGTNSRMDEIQAAILRHRLPQLNDLNRRRKKIWNIYEAAIDGSEWRILGDQTTGFVAHLGILVAPKSLRERAALFLQDHGVATAIHYPILDYVQPGWIELVSGSCPNAEELTKRILTIPLFPELRDEEVDAVASALRAMVRELNTNV